MSHKLFNKRDRTMQLKEIYQPIENELNDVAKTLEEFLGE